MDDKAWHYPSRTPAIYPREEAAAEATPERPAEVVKLLPPGVVGKLEAALEELREVLAILRKTL